MISGTRRILMVATVDTFFNTMLSQAKVLKQTGRYEAVIFFPEGYPHLKRDWDRCIAEGVAADIAGPLQPPQGAGVQSPYTFRKKLGNKIGSLAQKLRLDSVLWRMWLLKKKERLALSLIRKHRPSMILFGAGIIGHDMAIFTKAAHREGIPAVIYAAWMTDAMAGAEMLLPKKEYHLDGGVRRLVGGLFPKWVYEYKGVRMLRLTPAEILAWELMGIAPPNPWILHSGDYDAIFCESQAISDFAAAEGLPPQKLQTVGGLVHDGFAAARANKKALYAELCSKYGLDPSKPFIISALPPDMISYRPKGLCDFSSYSAVLEFWARSLAAVKEYNVLLSLHPSVRYEDMAFVEEWGVRIAREPMPQLMPLCDLFVASISATIQWAIACGVPVVDYDLYRYRYGYYADFPGVVTFEEKERFAEELRRMTTDLEYYEKHRALQRKRSHIWGVLDGKAGERLVGRLDEIIEKSQNGRGVAIPQSRGKKG